MPGTPEGRSPYDPYLMRDACTKADDVGAKYFFTWNVNTFVLFDRSKWDVQIVERRVKEWNLGLRLTSPGDCNRPDVRRNIREVFLPSFFAEFADIVENRIEDWGMPPDDLFIHSLESHLDWPITGTHAFLAGECADHPEFMASFCEWLARDMQWTFSPADPENWWLTLDRAAHTLCYIFSNRLIFYEAVRGRYPDRLAPLDLPENLIDQHAKYDYFRRRFADAVKATGDYEPVFYPEVDDSASALVLGSPKACMGWKGLLTNLSQYDFREIPHDIVGKIFQKLIDPQERQKFGQYFTHEDIVDVINAFCVRKASDVVLDPACGSGSFLVRAYNRKAWLDSPNGYKATGKKAARKHQELLRQIYGCDIALFPAHLATLNLAARQIYDQESYPLITRGNFFEVADHPESFCLLPLPSAGENGFRLKEPVPLVSLNAVVGNPPYVRQEAIPRRRDLKKLRGESRESHEARAKNTKEFFQESIAKAWPGLVFSGRSDLHCYFWPVAAKHLREGGYFGFITSSSWLDVEYGFALQRWILLNFRVVAIIESVDEPWFEDARVKTCATILQRCGDHSAREANLVKFVRLQIHLADILGTRKPDDETARQEAATSLRDLVESITEEYSDERLRIIPRSQADLWEDGVAAGAVLSCSPATREADAEDADEDGGGPSCPQAERIIEGSEDYVAGKWGRFLRAPDLYFRLMRDYGKRFIRLGEIADVRFGIKSGCDAFFMPHDVTSRTLRAVEEGLAWNSVGLMTPCTLKDVQSGELRIIEAGDRTLHAIEAEYLRPEVHSLMAVDRPVIRPGDIDRVVLWVSQPLDKLRGTYVAKYIRWGAKQTFSSKRSGGVYLPDRSTCAARPLWYDLTGGRRGVAFWPKSQQYRHIAPANPEETICNCNLYDVIPDATLSKTESQVLVAVLNSTLVGLFKTYYGRYAGTEGNLKTEVVDVKLMDVPSVKGVPKAIAQRMLSAFESLQKRASGHLVEGQLMQCHTTDQVKAVAGKSVVLSEELSMPDRRTLDDAVLEMIGVDNAKNRDSILGELYLETAKHFRQIRIVEVQKQVQRAGGSQRKLTAEDIAGSIWDSLDDSDKEPSLLPHLRSLGDELHSVEIPEGSVCVLGVANMFSPTGVDFREKNSTTHATYASVEEAALVGELAELGIRSSVDIPATAPACAKWRSTMRERVDKVRPLYEDLAASRTGVDSVREAIASILLHWFIHGRE